MVSEDCHRSVARIAIENCKFERVNEIGIALRVVTQLAQFTFGHRAKSWLPILSTTLEASRAATARDASKHNTYLGEAAAAGAAIAGEGALIADEGAAIAGAIGGSLPALACIDDFVAAFAASFACRLQR